MRFGHSPRGPEAERLRHAKGAIQVRLRAVPGRGIVRDLTCAVCGAWHEVRRMGAWTCSSACAARYRRPA